MPGATTSGADAKSPNGAAKSRDHNQGNQEKKYTIEQKTAVIRVRKCQGTAFYEILGVEKSASDGEIKKAYRKLSLLTHPDKNGYEGADEAFKMVSRAFQILSDNEKKEKYDRFGGDPDSRFGSGSAPSASPFSGFARSPGARGPMFEDEISPEELFNQFFGGGGMGGPFGGGGGPFGNGGFMFNMGGGPGFRVHQFGGGRPRRRPATANGGPDAQRPQGLLAAFSNLLPLLILFVLPLLSSLFSSSMPSGPSIHFQETPPYTHGRVTSGLKIKYWTNPTEIQDYSNRKFNDLDRRADNQYVNDLRYACEIETRTRNRMVEDAQGWFFPDERKLREAQEYDMKACKRLDGLGRGYF